MKILITNDDGICAAGLIPLVEWAKTKGEVVVAAPKCEQSAKSHSIEIHKPFEVKKVDLCPDVTAYAIDSAPADCVRIAVLGLGMHFDLVISGINRGFNIGRDIMYSGTVSAVMEAANLGLRGIAVSTSASYYLDAVQHMDEVLDYLEKHDLFSRNLIYNINIPQGNNGRFRVTRQGGNYFSDDFADVGNDLYQPCGKDVFAACQSLELDTDAVLIDKMISVMPLTMDRTDLALFRKLKDEGL